MTAGMAAIFVVGLMYSTIRHFDRVGTRKARTAASALEAVKQLDSHKWLERFSQNMLWSFSQQVVHYALIVDRFTQTGELEKKPLNTFHFLLVYPIPRAIYPDKPRSLGRSITFGVLGRTTTWGTGVAGQSKYEGGLIVAAMFGYFIAFIVRLFDDPLNRQITNPFLIGMLASAGMHLIAWPRGDLAVMTFEIVECFFFVWVFAIVCRFLFGTSPAPRGAAPTVSGYQFARHSS